MKRKNAIKKSPMIPTALIAGGAGFVGSHVAEALLEKGARVIALDNFETGKRNFVEHLLSHPNFALYDCDINEGLPDEIESVDYIFHLAGLEDYAYSKEVLNLDSLLTNAVGTKRLLDLSLKSQAKFVLLSTIDVYEGRMSQVELSDYFGRNKITENKYMLAEAKRYAEALVWEFYKKYDLDLRIVRLPEVYGPRMSLDASGVMGSFLQQVINHRDIVVSGEGVEKEYYLYISDAVSGILKAIFTEKTSGNIYSLVPEEPVSVLELAYLVRSLADSGVQVKFAEAHSEDYFKSGALKVPDTYNLSEIKWSPKVELKAGIVRALKALNFEPNQHSFKPNKIIEQKIAELKSGSSHSLSDGVKVTTLSKAPRAGADVPKPDKTEAISPAAQETEHSIRLFSLNDVKKDQNVSQNSEGAATAPLSKDTSARRSAFEKSVLSQPSKVYDFLSRTKGDINFAGESPKQHRTFLSKFSLPSLPKIKLPALRFRRTDDSGFVSSSPGFSAPTLFSSKFTIVIALLVPAFFVFVGLPTLELYSRVKKGTQDIMTLKAEGFGMTTDEIQETAESSYRHFYGARVSLKKLHPIMKITGQSSRYESYDMLLSSLTKFSKGVYYLAKAAKPVENLWEVIRPDTIAELDSREFQSALVQLDNSSKNLQFALTDLSSVDTQHIPEKYRPQIAEYADFLSVSRESFEFISPLFTSIPDILGAASPRTYMILFQNSNEIRPTGGFIGSYAIIDFDKGKIKNLYIDDIYNPDGQIDQRNILSAVPAPVVEFLGEERLHIRNANWDPDFTNSANTIADLYFKVTGVQVDGVFAVDLYFIKNILNATGPIFLTAYNEEITPENIYERAEMHSEFNYTDGSDQKKNFLTTLGSKLLEKLFSLDREKIPMLLDQIKISLEQRHMLLHFANDPINAFLGTQKWNGSFVPVEGDYLYVVNANVGGTKANYYVKNSIDYQINTLTRDGVLRGELILTYDHTGKDSAWPGGPYTDYLRVYTQKGAKLTGASIMYGQGEAQDIFERVGKGTNGLYDYFALSFVLNPQETAIVKLNYDLAPSLILTKSSADYTLYFQKQPGTQDDSFHFGFQIPFGFDVASSSPELVSAVDMLESTWSVRQDKELYVKLQ